MKQDAQGAALGWKMAVTIFRAAEVQFSRFVDSPARGRAARRWLMNAILQELDVEFASADFEAVNRLLAEVKQSPAKEVIPDLPGYLDMHEAMAAMLNLGASQRIAIDLHEGVVSRKRVGGSIAQWYHSEAGAKDLYLLGAAYRRVQDFDRAERAWRDGLNFTDSMGNQIWRARCQAELDAMHS